tara:strand:+ start:509 stop:1756 length:1248 start_codon:yes stop_codon:yes gene_type:complete
MSDFVKAFLASKPLEQKETEKPTAKEISTDLKSRITAYKKRVSSFKAEDGSPLKGWQTETINKSDEILNLIQNPELIGNQDIDIISFMTESEKGYRKIIGDNGGNVQAASIAPVENVDDFFLKQNIKNEKSEAKLYKNEIFDKLEDNEKSTVVDNVRLFNNAMDKGIYNDYNTYIKQIREQFRNEDKLITQNPAIKSELDRLKKKLNQYDASILWSRFKAQNEGTSDLKAFLKEELGNSPIIVFDAQAEKEYQNLVSKYAKIMKDVTGFDTQWNAVPLEFKLVPGGGPTGDRYVAFATGETEAVNWTIEQIKDRNEFIEYAAASHVSSDIQKATGMDINKFNKAIDSILEEPQNYHASFISGLEDLNTTIDYLVEQLDVNLDELKYGKKEFLTAPVVSDKTVDPSSARIDFIESK